jgi:protein ImuA
VVLVGAPLQPFGPALGAQGLAPRRLLWVDAPAPAQRLWATEQALRCADVDAVLAWLVQVRPEQLRRLQIASAEFDKLLFVLRPEAAQAESSPAALRLWAAPGAARHSGARDDALEVRALKRRGPPLVQSLHLAARSAHLARLLAASGVAPTRRSEHALDRTAACA